MDVLACMGKQTAEGMVRDGISCACICINHQCAMREGEGKRRLSTLLSFPPLSSMFPSGEAARDVTWRL